MEELRSTEALDREILEDARKRAQKILKNAEDAAQAQTRSWEKKTQDAIDELKEHYAGRIKKAKEETSSRLTLDKRRIRAETSETFIDNAVAAFLTSLSKQDLLRILEDEFAKRIAACDKGFSGKAKIFYHAMSKDEALYLVKKVMAGSKLKEISDSDVDGFEFSEDFHFSLPGTKNAAFQFPALVFDVPELRLTASVESAAMEMLDEKRAELVSALLGEGALND